VVKVAIRVSRTAAVRGAAVLMLAVMVLLPASSAYLSSSFDLTDHVREGSCYCHTALPDANVTIVLDVPSQVAYTPSNETVRVGVGILGEPHNITAFGLFLNASEDAKDLKWTRRFSNDTIDRTNAVDLIKVNTTSVWTIGKITEPWFNLTFVPGQDDQFITLTVAGMRADDSGDETGDLWNLATTTIEVRKQRLMNLTVGVTNQGDIAVNDVLVDFYIDDEYVGNNSVTNIAPGSTENATVEWDITFKKDGKYRLRAVIDPLGTITETDGSNNEVTRDIWLGGPPEEPDYTRYYGLGGLAVGIVVALVLYWYWRRRQYRF